MFWSEREKGEETEKVWWRQESEENERVKEVFEEGFVCRLEIHFCDFCVEVVWGPENHHSNEFDSKKKK